MIPFEGPEEFRLERLGPEAHPVDPALGEHVGLGGVERPWVGLDRPLPPWCEREPASDLSEEPFELPGVQPEWFYKGNGFGVAAPGAPLASPAFALDGGEEPEIAGIYVIGPDGSPARVGWALANEFSDHVTERINYLFLAHSKLRPCAFGPEILVGDLPASVEGTSRIRRDGAVVWEKPFLSGEANMSHAFANLEHHHFKYDLFRRPGDVHVHMFGTATLSFAAGLRCETGDVFEIEAPGFGLPLRNPLRMADTAGGGSRPALARAL